MLGRRILFILNAVAAAGLFLCCIADSGAASIRITIGHCV